MDLKQIVAGCAPDEVPGPFKALNEASDRLFREEANAQEPGLDSTKTRPNLLLLGLSSDLRVKSMYQHMPTWRGDASAKLFLSLAS